MNKFILQAMLTATILTAALTGCSSKGKSTASDTETVTQMPAATAEGTVSLRVWGAQEDQELLQEIVDKFKEENTGKAEFDIKIEAESEATCKKAILENIEECPDVFTFADDQLMALAAAGVLTPIENANKIKEENMEGAVEAASINDTLYAYPLTADNGYFMFYNKQYFTEEDVKTLDGMLNVAERNGQYITMDWTSGWYLYSFFGNTGLKLQLNDNGITNTCNWNDQKAKIKGVDVAEGMLAIARRQGFKNGNDEALTEGAKDGSVIAGVSGVWVGSKLKEAWGSNYAAVKLPTYTCDGEQVQMGSYVGYKLVGVNSYSSNQKWASELAEWITNEQNQTLRFEKRGQGPSNKNASASEAVKADPAMTALLEQSNYGSLQRVGGKYWEPAEAFGIQMAGGNAEGEPLQQVMDTLVEKITASN